MSMGGVEAEEGPEEEPEEARPVKGFLAVKCDICGDRRIAFLKDYDMACLCHTCGAEIEVNERNTKLAFANCQNCGNELYYRTNFTAQIIHIPCKRCGRDIRLELSEDGADYKTAELE